MTSPTGNRSADAFTAADAWTGGHYELAMELGRHSDSSVIGALRRLWAYPLLERCYLRMDQATTSQARVAPEAHLDETLYGVATIEEHKVPCGTSLCRFEEGSDWLSFYLPLASLERIYPTGGYPFNVGPQYGDWQRRLDLWLIAVAKYVFQEAPFLLALVGSEVEIATTSSDTVLAAGIPKVRSEGILVPRRGALEWHAPTS